MEGQLELMKRLILLRFVPPSHSRLTIPSMSETSQRDEPKDDRPDRPLDGSSDGDVGRGGDDGRSEDDDEEVGDEDEVAYEDGERSEMRARNAQEGGGE